VLTIIGNIVSGAVAVGLLIVTTRLGKRKPQPCSYDDCVVCEKDHK
jgi:hypothetical protein